MATENHIAEETSTLQELNERVKKMAVHLEKTQIADYVQLLNSPKRLIVMNILAGVARGVGIAIGFTIFTGTIVYILRKLGALNLPIIGDYIADIVRIVQNQLDGRAF